MSLLFPSNPSTNDQYSFQENTWKYNGVAWDKIIISGITGPAGPTGSGGALGYWGSFWDIGDKGVTSTSVANGITFSNSDPSNSGIALYNNEGILFSHTGVYNIQFSVQIKNTDNNEQEATFWFKKNGTDIPDTGGVVSIPKQRGAGSPGYAITSWNVILPITGGDKISLYWHPSSTSVTLHTFPAGTSPVHSQSPSVILTAQQVMFTQLGPTGPTGPAGTISGGYVSSLNGFSGGITLAAGNGINISSLSNIITIENQLYILIDGGTY